jgi:hypothetical protein
MAPVSHPQQGKLRNGKMDQTPAVAFEEKSRITLLH